MYLLAICMSSLENGGTLNWLAKLGTIHVLWASELLEPVLRAGMLYQNISYCII